MKIQKIDKEVLPLAWYRIAVVDYPEKLRKTVFSGEQNSRIPRAVALETGQPAEDFDEIEEVNVVYYFDLEKEIECGDFFFVSVSEALDWCDSALGINPTAFNIFDPPIILSE